MFSFRECEQYYLDHEWNKLVYAATEFLKGDPSNRLMRFFRSFANINLYHETFYHEFYHLAVDECNSIISENIKDNCSFWCSSNLKFFNRTFNENCKDIPQIYVVKIDAPLLKYHVQCIKSMCIQFMKTFINVYITPGHNLHELSYPNLRIYNVTDKHITEDFPEKWKDFYTSQSPAVKTLFLQSVLLHLRGGISLAADVFINKPFELTVDREMYMAGGRSVYLSTYAHSPTSDQWIKEIIATKTLKQQPQFTCPFLSSEIPLYEEKDFYFQDVKAVHLHEERYRARLENMKPMDLVSSVLYATTYIRNSKQLRLFTARGGIYIIVHEGLWRIIYDYLMSIYMRGGINGIITYYGPEPDILFNDIHYFDEDIKFLIINFDSKKYNGWNRTRNAINWNVEPLPCDINTCNKISLHSSETDVPFLDYSEYNISSCSGRGLFMPYQYFSICDGAPARDIDMGMFSTDCARRLRIENKLPTVGKYKIYKYDTWFNVKLGEIPRMKILLNVHSYDGFNVMQQLRVNIAIFNRVIVISDRCGDEEKYHMNKYIIYCNFDQLIETARDVLDNYDDHWEKIYGTTQFDLDELNLYYSRILNETLHYIKQLNNH